MGLLGNSGGGSPGLPSVITNLTVTSGVNNSALATDTDPNNIVIKAQDAYAQAATNTSGGDLSVAAGLGRRFVTVVDYSLIDAGADTITITINGTANVGTEGTNDATHWSAATSNAVTATNIATWADQLSGVSAVASGDVCYITADSSTYSLTLATSMAAGEGTVTSGTDGTLTLPNPTLTGVAKFDDGSAAAPSIAKSSAPTFGWYWSSNSIFYGNGGSASFGVRGDYTALRGTGILAWTAAADSAEGTIDTTVARAAANSVVFAGATPSAGAVTSRTEINKAVTAFTNAAAKTVFTVTVPNAAHHAVLEVEVQGALGAGGAIGAGEAMATNTYKIAIVRTAGVATVATATAATHAVAVAVAGAATVTATAAVSAISGAVGATQTFTIDVTITKSGGLSDNHTCLAYAKLMNANATGITIA